MNFGAKSPQKLNELTDVLESLPNASNRKTSIIASILNWERGNGTSHALQLYSYVRFWAALPYHGLYAALILPRVLVTGANYLLKLEDLQ